MIAAEPADALTIVLDRGLRPPPPGFAAPEIVRPPDREGPDPLLAPTGGTLPRRQDLTLDLARLTQTRRQIKTQGPDLGPRDIALRSDPRVIELDDRPTVLEPHTHAGSRAACHCSHSDTR